MASVFNMQEIGYALEKIGDFIRRSGSGALPGYANAGITAVIVESLRACEEKLRAHHTPKDVIAYHLGPAIYAACQLQSHVTGDKSDIPNRDAAEVYRGFLKARIEELHHMEQGLDS
jgi:hypothetical protein